MPPHKQLGRVAFPLMMSAFLCIAAPSRADDLGPIASAHEAFNAAASKAGLDVSAKLLECSAANANVCTIKMTGGLAALSSSSVEDHSRARDFTIMVGRDSDPVAFVSAVLASMLAWSPDASNKARSVAFRTLVSSKMKKKSEVQVGRMRYKMLPLKAIGLWFIVEPI